MRSIKTLSLIGLLLAPLLAIAAGPASAPQADVTKEQFLKEADTRFAALDTNKDGKVTQAERQVQRGRGMGPGASMPAEMTREQHQQWAQERFAVLDTNKDGKITQDERRAGRGAHGGFHHGMGASMPAEMTKAEHLKYAESRFAALDTNKDGKITLEERQAARAKFRAEHHGSGPMGRGPAASAPAIK